jgi:hypothetical protein
MNACYKVGVKIWNCVERKEEIVQRGPLKTPGYRLRSDNFKVATAPCYILSAHLDLDHNKSWCYLWDWWSEVLIQKRWSELKSEFFCSDTWFNLINHWTLARAELVRPWIFVQTSYSVLGQICWATFVVFLHSRLVRLCTNIHYLQSPQIFFYLILQFS